MFVKQSSFMYSIYRGISSEMKITCQEMSDEGKNI